MVLAHAIPHKSLLSSEVLNRGIPLNEVSVEYPKKMYAVFRGVIYEASKNNWDDLPPFTRPLTFGKSLLVEA
jgi:hypothetical protein